PPTDNSLSVPLLSPLPNPSPPATNTFQTPVTQTSAPAVTVSLKESVSFPTKTLSAPLTVTSLLNVTNKTKSATMNIIEQQHDDDSNAGDDDGKNGDYDVIDGVCINNGSGGGNTKSKNKPSTSSSPISLAHVTLLTNPKTSISTSTTLAESSGVGAGASESKMATVMDQCSTATDSLSPTSCSSAATTPARPFEMFTCKLCLVDVENDSNSTTLHQCGCQFCTERLLDTQ
ncbi:hypothetical protein DOY81_012282, partial [Sarcophaga bullata]